MLISFVISEGILLGPPENIHHKITTLSGYDLALASFLLAMAPNPGYHVFNVAEPAITLGHLLRQIAEHISQNKIFGIETRLSNILKIGYQENIAMPNFLLELIGNFSEQANDFLNQFRFQKKKKPPDQKCSSISIGP